ncbi:MAG: winged helix-turn-helix transcriptional regulator [Pedobacter sp.]|nr:MAG: winged helix-turn-helix transcriptional regulator [Pedobacter sp.]
MMLSSKNRQLIYYSVAFAVLFGLLKWIEYQFLVRNYTFEIYASAIALLFTSLGIWIALKITRPKATTIIFEKNKSLDNTNDFKPNEKLILQLGLSKRELEVLELMAQGLSNQEISENLFVSLNTVKTHISRLFTKLNVKRRTQAVEMAKKSAIIL